MESAPQSNTVNSNRRNQNNSEQDLSRRTNAHDYSLRSAGRPAIVTTPTHLPDVLPSVGIPENVTSCPNPRPPSRRCHRKSHRKFVRRLITKALIPILFMAGSVATYSMVEWRVGALRATLDDLAADSSLLRDHFLSLAELLNEQMRMVEDRVASSVSERLLTQLWLRDNDKTGVADFALESAGAEIVSTNGTEPWPSTPTFLEAALRVVPAHNGPRQMIKPGMSPGECWAFRGSKGEAVIRLVTAIRVTSVSVEHITKNISPTGFVTSAPRDFEVLALPDPDGQEEVIGRFTYLITGPALQMFYLPVPSATTSFIGLRVLSNHGHPLYTCVYRFRVHGNQPSVEKDSSKNCDKPH